MQWHLHNFHYPLPRTSSSNNSAPSKRSPSCIPQPRSESLLSFSWVLSFLKNNWAWCICLPKRQRRQVAPLLTDIRARKPRPYKTLTAFRARHAMPLQKTPAIYDLLLSTFNLLLKYTIKSLQIKPAKKNTGFSQKTDRFRKILHSPNRS